MRLTGHSMATGAEGDGAAADRLSLSMPRLEHPYGALALVLALSGSQRWPSVIEDNGLESQEDRGGKVSAGDSWTAPNDQGREGEWLGQGLETSRLWSTDSEEEEAAGGKLSLFPGLETAEQLDGGEMEEGTSEWLKAFESDGADSDGELSPHTDGEYERPASRLYEWTRPLAHDWQVTQGGSRPDQSALFAKNRLRFVEWFRFGFRRFIFIQCDKYLSSFLLPRSAVFVFVARLQTKATPRAGASKRSTVARRTHLRPIIKLLPPLRRQG